MSSRILYLATADARGHLMRAQLLVHALREAGAQVEVLTTSEQGQRFLQPFGIEAELLSPHYAVQFDSEQNMLRKATNRNVAHYLFRPSRMLRDILRLGRRLRSADLVINDSFHPALLYMGMLPGWRRKVVHVYGASLKVALLNNFDGMWPRQFGRLFGWIVGRQIGAARACIEHDFAYEVDDANAPALYRLPTPVALASTLPAAADGAAVYLNPHFSEPSLAAALSAGLTDAGLAAHLVGEGYAGRSGWLAVDPLWASRAAQAQLLVSAPGMAALSIAQVYRRPIILVLSDQPEQASNAARAAQLQLLHRVVTWRGDAADFRRQVAQAAMQLSAVAAPEPTGAPGRACAQARIDAWVSRLLSL
ncbi:hypothetical protein GV819_17585 [Pseudomonas sp. Fl5BN2]|uniref:glycosyltransferase family 1 protein n=1 Tax=unclassified Pseudomonas TaxID=196821 RepID=UPI001378269B|nr:MULTISPECIES: glycosyltransferase family 1 protein [unclassified Pseudomonas]NBF04101.1 hypothetical protein [Pseudomonas sp. Fl5BN2]NBF09652.1 hypothetical protein [Pseudomonas sp. Fl4BN1]